MISFFIGGLTLYAQSLSDSYTAQPPQVIAPSPQSQIFERYINHKIDESTGTPEISIPLYEINIKGLTIPIALSYHAGGVRYKQYDGETGAGWSIGAVGYRISRTLKNKPDEASNFYSRAELDDIQSDIARDRQLSGICLGGVIPLFYPIASNWEQDSEYDLFTYTTPSTGAHFIISDRSNKSNLRTTVLEANRDIVTINVQQTSALNHNYITEISITDDNGIQYNYGGYDSQQNLLVERANVSEGYSAHPETAWPLRQIQTPYNEEIKFKYESYCPLIDKTMNSVRMFMTRVICFVRIFTISISLTI